MSDSDDFEARFGRRAEDLGKFPDQWTDPSGEDSDPSGEDPDAGTFDGAEAGEAYVPTTIICVDCGSTCHLITPPYEDPDGGPPGFMPGDVVAYRCEDCLDRWDIVVE
jgi:hypothetical protein